MGFHELNFQINYVRSEVMADLFTPRPNRGPLIDELRKERKSPEDRTYEECNACILAEMDARLNKGPCAIYSRVVGKIADALESDCIDALEWDAEGGRLKLPTSCRP